MPSTLPFALYNPALLPAEALLGEFVARKPMLAALLETIRQNAPGRSPQHVLLVGARGMGKTTTLWAIAHSVNRDAELARAWQPVVFDEESRRIGDLADFWLEAIRQWEHATKDPADRASALLDEAPDDIEERARQAFLEAVNRNGRRALLLVDNLNDALSAIRDPAALHRLRAVLMEESRFMLIGGATRYFPEVTDVDQPFYDFFRVFELKPLSLDEMKACLLSLAQTRSDADVEKAVREREGTMRSLHLLTGGNPRLIKTFYRLLAEGLQGDIRADLERLLDEFTPYFKSIVDALPVQQQRILDAVALNWDPVDVATIARATRLPSNQISAQLRTLVKAGHVAEAPGHPKRKSYLLADRFSNIHYLMRHGRAARSRFDWFVAILRLVFPDGAHADTLAKLARQTAECGPDGRRDARDLLHSALARLESAESRRQLVQAAFRDGWDSEAFASLSEWFDTTEAKQHLPETDVLAFFQKMPISLRRQIGFKPNEAAWWVGLTSFLREKSAWSLAESAYQKAIEIDPEDSYLWVALGHLLRDHFERFAEAESVYRKAIELAPKKTYPWVCLGFLLESNLGRPEEAESAYRTAITLDSKEAYPWACLGRLLRNHSQRFEEAEAAYRTAIVLDPKDAYPWNGLGQLLQDHFSRFPEAEAAYRKAIKLDPKYAFAWTNLGELLQNDLGRLQEAETAYRMATELDTSNSWPWTLLAELLARLGERAYEARTCAVKSLTLEPDNGYAQHVFTTLCAHQSDDWRAILPHLATWSTAHPKANEVFEFTIAGFVRLSQLTSPSDALNLLKSTPETTAAFETLRDALLAHADRSHLDRLAPERRVVAIELLKKISAPAAADN